MAAVMDEILLAAVQRGDGRLQSQIGSAQERDLPAVLLQRGLDLQPLGLDARHRREPEVPALEDDLTRDIRADDQRRAWRVGGRLASEEGRVDRRLRADLARDHTADRMIE